MAGLLHASPPRSHSAPLPRLLLVEDNAILRGSLDRSLRRRYAVTALADGAEAAEVLKQESFDVVLTDVRLEGVTGLELLRLLRSGNRDTPVILMTGLPELDDALEAMDLGAVTYMRKPFDRAALEAALERATKLSSLARVERAALDARPGTESTAERAALEGCLDRALDSLWIAFQPIVHADSRRTVGFEALMRSIEPTLPTPIRVLETAEKLGRVHDVGRRVRERAAARFEDDASDTLLFVNLHAADLVDDDLFDPAAPLSRVAHRTVLEITERAALGSVTDASERAAALRALGFKIAVDDLGAGYAGLTSFATFEPEIVKLDMSLVRGIGSSSVKRMLVGRLAALCRDLSIRVVAEGIETPEELALVLELGCEYAQGYLLGRPEERRRVSDYPW